MQNLISKCLMVALAFAIATPFAYGVGPIMEGMEIGSNDLGRTILRISNGFGEGGIAHDLNPDDWYRYRVKVTHSDAPGRFFVSDGFAPTSENIQLCTVGGCEALPIDLGIDPLDWEDELKIQVFLQGKACMLCEWVDHAANPL